MGDAARFAAFSDSYCRRIPISLLSDGRYRGRTSGGQSPFHFLTIQWLFVRLWRGRSSVYNQRDRRQSAVSPGLPRFFPGLLDLVRLFHSLPFSGLRRRTPSPVPVFPTGLCHNNGDTSTPLLTCTEIHRTFWATKGANHVNCKHFSQVS